MHSINKIYNNNYLFRTLLWVTFYIAVVNQTSCTKLVAVKPPITSISSENVFSTDATAASVLTGIYTTMSISYFPGGGMTSLSLFPGLSADELSLFPGSTNAAYIGYFQNSLTNLNTSNTDFWRNIYPLIYVANSAIEGLTDANSLTPAARQQLLGEAEFVRAFCYFYLVNLYGDVPLVVGTDYTVNSTLSRTPSAQVYQAIIADLKDAQTKLNSDFVGADAVTTTTERTRPTKWAATALLARTYLFTGDWTNAEAQASAVINNSGTFSLVSELNGVFLANSSEAVWQLQPVLSGYNTQDANLFILPASGPDKLSFSVYLDSLLLNSFEANDLRRMNWIDSVMVPGLGTFYYAYKYKVNTPGAPLTEYSMVLRLGELYLIRSEAEANLNDLSNAANDLNVIRSRAGLPNTTAATQANLLTAIMHERQTELFTEWGHRWFDLKRTGAVDSVMAVVTPVKGGSWNTNWQWYPIPLSELKTDPNLVQNKGY